MCMCVCVCVYVCIHIHVYVYTHSNHPFFVAAFCPGPGASTLAPGDVCKASAAVCGTVTDAENCIAGPIEIALSAVSGTLTGQTLYKLADCVVPNEPSAPPPPA